MVALLRRELGDRLSARHGDAEFDRVGVITAIGLGAIGGFYPPGAHEDAAHRSAAISGRRGQNRSRK
jgi:hypothetical protein